MGEFDDELGQTKRVRNLRTNSALISGSLSDGGVLLVVAMALDATGTVPSAFICKGTFKVMGCEIEVRGTAKSWPMADGLRSSRHIQSGRHGPMIPLQIHDRMLPFMKSSF